MVKRIDKKKARFLRGARVNGDLLRHLRLLCGKKQLELAESIGSSDRLVRHAESGAVLQWSSIRLFARFYGLEDISLITLDDYRELVASKFPGHRLASRTLIDFLCCRWESTSKIPPEWMHPKSRYHGEACTLTGANRILKRLAQIQKSIGAVHWVPNEMGSQETAAACRWTIFPIDSTVIRMRCGITTIRLEGPTIVEIWDYWDPNHFFCQSSMSLPSGAVRGRRRFSGA